MERTPFSKPQHTYLKGKTTKFVLDEVTTLQAIYLNYLPGYERSIREVGARSVAYGIRTH